MRKYSKAIGCDKRGQLVIPKEVRKELSVDEGTAFWVFYVENEGILLKRIDDEVIDSQEPVLREVSEKAEKLDVDKKNIERTKRNYSGKEEGGFREI
ncbi:hypothetical protein GF345_01030 [Candidatus Woesearchaeota archaeon]|nr:hypothetical protein [Candidatus Woesearchaeota archaeon]